MVNSRNGSRAEEGVTCTGLSREYTLAKVSNIHIQLHSYQETSAIRELCYHLRRDLWYTQSSDEIVFSINLAGAATTVYLLRLAAAICSPHPLTFHTSIPRQAKRLPLKARRVH